MKRFIQLVTSYVQTSLHLLDNFIKTSLSSD